MNRLEYNLQCIDILKSFIVDYPDLRIEQIISMLDGKKDRFYEESDKTLHRWKNVYATGKVGEYFVQILH